VLAFAVGFALIGAELSRPAHAAPFKEPDYRLSSLRVFNRVVLLVKEQYVEPQRIHPREMLVAALEAVEKRVPEVLVEEPEGDSIGVVVGDVRRTFFLDDLNSLWELSFKLRDVFRFVETRVSKEVDGRDIEYAAVNGMLSKLDPHSVLLEPRYSKEMKLSTKGEFGGLGIVISIRDGYLTVISPIDGTPADRAGIRAQDRIVKIGEESTVNMSLDEAVERLRGKPGTEVVIWVTRKGLDEPKRVGIVRDIIKVDSVTHHLLEGKLGYVKIKQFQGRTAEDVSGAIREMKKEAGGNLKGLVLDLRNNPGGLLDQAVEVSNLFLRDGVLVITQEGGAHGERKEVRATRRPDKVDVPLVVLVNGGSASASEIVAGAVKNRGRGLIVGDQTFGKGSVQQLYDFPDSSSLKLTIGQYLTPGDESIQSVGITPDVLSHPVLVEDRSTVNLFADRHTREEDLELHLDDSRIVARKPSFELSFLDAILDEGELERRATSSSFHDDFQIRFARRVLSVAQGSDRKALLDAARVAVDEEQELERGRIAGALDKLSIDWTRTKASKGGKLAGRVVEAVPVKAGEALKVTVEVENKGSTTLEQVHGNSESTLGLLSDREFLYGKLAPGAKATWTSEVKIPKNLASREDLMRVSFADAWGQELGAVDVPVSIHGLDRPRFSYALFIDDGEGGNGDGMLQVGSRRRC
jgi:carboxyl-terminal processing protease